MTSWAAAVRLVAVHDGQDLVRGDGAFDDGQGDGAHLVVLRHGGHGAHLPVARTHLAADRGQGVLGTVELEEHETARRVAQVVDARDRLLALVAALGQVHGSAEEVELVRDGLVVRFRAPAGPPRRNPQRFGRHGAGEGTVAHGRDQLVRGDQVLKPGPFQSWMGVLAHHSVGVAAGADVRPRVFPGLQRLPFRDAVCGAEYGPVGGDVGDFDPEHELHLVEPFGERGRLGCLDDQPGRGAVVHHPGVEFDPALHAQQQQFGGLARGQRSELLGGQRVEPAQAVRPADRHHTAV